MKNLILTFFIAACFSSQLMSTDPVIDDKCCPVVVSTAEVDFSYDVDLYSRYFSPAYFNEETNSLHFEASRNIGFIQITNAEGKLEFKLPVMSNKVRINKDLFNKGEYKLEFDLGDESEALVTYVTIN